jgi:hypothetical protein
MRSNDPRHSWLLERSLSATKGKKPKASKGYDWGHYSRSAIAKDHTKLGWRVEAFGNAVTAWDGTDARLCDAEPVGHSFTGASLMSRGSGGLRSARNRARPCKEQSLAPFLRAVAADLPSRGQGVRVEGARSGDRPLIAALSPYRI